MCVAAAGRITHGCCASVCLLQRMNELTSYTGTPRRRHSHTPAPAAYVM